MKIPFHKLAKAIQNIVKCSFGVRTGTDEVHNTIYVAEKHIPEVQELLDALQLTGVLKVLPNCRHHQNGLYGAVARITFYK